MSAKITALIDKQDTNEIIRDQIAAILTIEEANQRALATAAGEDPNDWKFNVYTERSIPWETSEMPLVNVLFDNDRFDNKNSSPTNRQRATGIFYIDCYASKNTTDDDSGDELASREADRIARLVRNILQASEYQYLLLGYREYGVGNNLVSSRKIVKREKFQPDIRNEVSENIIACRLTLEVDYDEFSPQASTVDFELLINSCKRGDDDKLLFKAQYDMTEEE